jgi:hypothetical protein
MLEHSKIPLRDGTTPFMSHREELGSVVRLASLFEVFCGWHNLSRLTPSKIVRIIQGIYKNSKVDEWPRNDMDKISSDILCSLQVVAWQPKNQAERVNLLE